MWEYESGLVWVHSIISLKTNQPTKKKTRKTLATISFSIYTPYRWKARTGMDTDVFMILFGLIGYSPDLWLKYQQMRYNYVVKESAASIRFVVASLHLIIRSGSPFNTGVCSYQSQRISAFLLYQSTFTDLLMQGVHLPQALGLKVFII